MRTSAGRDAVTVRRIASPARIYAWVVANALRTTRRPFFLLGGVLIAQLVLVDRLVGEQPFIHPENAFRLPGLLVAGIAATYPNERLRVGLAVVATVLFLGFVAFTFSR